MLLLFLTTLLIVGPDIQLVSGTCSSSQLLTASSSEGTIEQNKSINLDCQWTIQSTGPIEINITEWSLDQCQDNLTIYDGTLVMASLCDTGSALIMISGSYSARVWLRTGNTYTGTGFRMTYRLYSNPLPDCFIGYQWKTRYYIKATENEQVITSRNYPNNYPENYREEWLIMKPDGSDSLAIVIEDMDIEDSKYECYDYLEVINGKCGDDKRVVRTCGGAKDSWTLTGTPYVLIRFLSDSKITGRGFRLKYYIGTLEDLESDQSNLQAILIGLIAACICVMFLLASAKLYMRCFKHPKVIPNHTRLQNRRAMLELQVRRGAQGSSLNRMMTARSIHAEMTRYLNNSTTSDHDSRVSTFEISTSQSSGHGLVYQDGLFQPPSYSTLFNHAEEPPPVTTELIDMAPPPYPGSPVIYSERYAHIVSVAHSSPVHAGIKENNGLAEVETTEPPPYNAE